MMTYKIPTTRVVLLIACMAVALCAYGRFFDRFELWTYDLRFALKPVQQADSVVIVEVEDNTLADLGQWPLPRDFHASLVQVLDELGAKAIIFDMLFSEPSAHDEAFAQSLEKTGKVYLPMSFYLANPRSYLDETPLATDITAALKSKAFSLGHINTIVDTDGKMRRVPLFIKHEGKLVPQIAFKAACDQLGIKTDNVVFKEGRLVLDQMEIPLSKDNAFLVNYPGQWQHTFKHVSYEQVLKSYMDNKEGKPAAFDLSFLKDKTCFIGLTATGTSDFRAVPLENTYPMLGLQASVFYNMMNKAFIRDAGKLINTGICLVVLRLSVVICWQLPPLNALGISVGMAIAYFITSVLLFNAGLWVDLFLPVFLIVMVYVAGLANRFMSELKMRQLMEKELEIAQKIQSSFLPRSFKGTEGINVNAFFQPAKFVAGDLYDAFKIDDNRVGIFIGDVAGKGVSAALVMAQAISLFRVFARQSSDCGTVLGNLNREMSGKLGGRFITALYLIIDRAQQKLFVAAAGHGPVWVYRDNTVIDVKLEAQGPLGIVDNFVYPTVVFDLQAGDQIIIFSDGLHEARNKNSEEFGLERIQALIVGQKSGNITDVMKKAVLDFSGDNIYDDITLMVIENRR